jgi:hypothetical protein
MGDLNAKVMIENEELEHVERMDLHRCEIRKSYYLDW